MERNIVGVVLASFFVLSTILYGVLGEDSFVFHVDSKEDLKEAITTTDSLIENNNLNFHRAELIVCGEVTRSLIDDIDTMNMLKSVDKEHVQVTVCEASLEKLNINPDELPLEIKVVESPERRISVLKQLGFVTIDL
ncbi:MULTISPECIES: hypothetical protein [Flammeovirga]|uniref:DsrE/DsrF-like family protein n=1 Tax=Flammeovirga agarivorans TaxID=2726742 RepID=A0A7X8SMD9_9BACT|nr:MULTISPECIES: hypothetical protein [Flammeovirga]NLR92880.1 hypothetical protein [Flammeovirga agarivorans]